MSTSTLHRPPTPTQTNSLGLYVPSEALHYAIIPGSAIVGEEREDGTDSRILIYFEGNKFNISGLQDYKAKAIQALSRLINRYPTVARLDVPADKMVKVGEFVWEAHDYWKGEVKITEPELFEAWTTDPNYTTAINITGNKAVWKG